MLHDRLLAGRGGGNDGLGLGDGLLKGLNFGNKEYLFSLRWSRYSNWLQNFYIDIFLSHLRSNLIEVFFLL